MKKVPALSRKLLDGGYTVIRPGEGSMEEHIHIREVTIAEHVSHQNCKISSVDCMRNTAASPVSSVPEFMGIYHKETQLNITI